MIDEIRMELKQHQLMATHFRKTHRQKAVAKMAFLVLSVIFIINGL